MNAFGGNPGFELRIASGKIRRAKWSNVSIAKATSEEEIKLLYKWADVVVVPLKSNLHISGSTAIFEAIVSGKPVVATDTGGLRAYFSDREISYVPTGEPTAMRAAVQRLAKDADSALAMVLAAQRHLVDEDFTTKGCAQRHRELTERILHKHKRTGEACRDESRRQKEKIKVFVHLGNGFGADGWRERFGKGSIPGLNEQLPYGYYRAADARWSVAYSQDADEGRLMELCRRGLTHLIGFDLIHAWRNRNGLLTSDIVWTHTEREHMAALFLFRLAWQRKRPSIIAQCIWLFDRWPELPLWKRGIYRWLLEQADAVTTHSPENLRRARGVLSNPRLQLVMFGIQSVSHRKNAKHGVARPVRIVALGNDMHRDWHTLIEAFGGFWDYTIAIASASAPRRLINKTKNITLRKIRTVSDLTELYDWADIVVVPLRENLHASGITVVLEATQSGLPVVCSDTGGLRAYFSDEEVRYVPVGVSSAMRGAVDAIAVDDSLRNRMVLKAQERIAAVDLTAQGFADRHRKLSEEILLRPAEGAEPAIRAS
jgi:glycosyltransferase involved in cell wall biosynthesis